MRVIFLHQHFKNPDSGGALRSYYLAIGLAALGHDVEVITATNHTDSKVDSIKGVKVHYLTVSYENRFGALKRIWSYLRFNRLSLKKLGELKRPDILYCISTPLTIGLAGLKAKEKWAIPYFFEVGDLWPQAPIEMGVIRSKLLQRYLYQMEATIYKEAETVIALSPPIEESINQRFPGVKSLLVPNMSDTSFFNKSPDEEQLLMPEYSFLIAYIGAIGKANHIDFMIKAAEYFEEAVPKVGFIIMGEGSELPRLKEISKDLSNLRFLPFGNRKVVRQVINQIDAVYISYKDLPVLETGCPNKLFDGLAAGKMIITNFKGWISELITKNSIGFSYEPEVPAQMLTKLEAYLEDKKSLQKISVRARNLSMHYSREHIVDILHQKLTTAKVLPEVPIGEA